MHRAAIHIVSGGAAWFPAAARVAVLFLGDEHGGDEGARGQNVLLCEPNKTNGILNIGRKGFCFRGAEQNGSSCASYGRQAKVPMSYCASQIGPSVSYLWHRRCGATSILVPRWWRRTRARSLWLPGGCYRRGPCWWHGRQRRGGGSRRHQQRGRPSLHLAWSMARAFRHAPSGSGIQGCELSVGLLKPL
jgi:hypothetical protein